MDNKSKFKKGQLVFRFYSGTIDKGKILRINKIVNAKSRFISYDYLIDFELTHNLNIYEQELFTNFLLL